MKIFSCQMGKMSYFCSHKNGGTVAQLVEQRTENPRVTGSIPVGTTTKKETQLLRLFFCFIYLIVGLPSVTAGLLRLSIRNGCRNATVQQIKQKKRLQLEALFVIV